MWFLSILCFFTTIFYFCFVVLCIVCFLYYASELVEEHTAIAKKVLQWSIYTAVVVNILMMFFESAPATLTTVNIVGHLAALCLARTFPCCQLLSVPFVLSFVAMIVGNYLSVEHCHQQRYTFSEALSYATVCVWLVPMQLLVSLNVNDYVLPTLDARSGGMLAASQSPHRLSHHEDDLVSNYFSRRHRGYSLKTLFASIKARLAVKHQKGF